MWIESGGCLRNLSMAKSIFIKNKSIMVAYTDGSSVMLGFYPTEEEAKEALADLLQILNA